MWIVGIVLASISGFVHRAQAQNLNSTADTTRRGLHTVDQVIEIRMADFHYYPDTLRVPSGETIMFVLRNAGDYAHTFTVVRNANGDRARQRGVFGGIEIRKIRMGKTNPDGDGDSADRAEDATDGPRHAQPKTVIQLRPDSGMGLAFQLPDSKEGRWEMSCVRTVPRPHYEVGMRGMILVK